MATIVGHRGSVRVAFFVMALVCVLVAPVRSAVAGTAAEVIPESSGAYSDYAGTFSPSMMTPRLGEDVALEAYLWDADDNELSGAACVVVSSADGVTFRPVDLYVEESAFEAGTYETEAFSVAGPVWYMFVWPDLGVQSPVIHVTPVPTPSAWSQTLGYASSRGYTAVDFTAPFMSRFIMHSQLTGTQPGIDPVPRTRVESSDDGLTFTYVAFPYAGWQRIEYCPQLQSLSPRYFRFAYPGDAVLGACASTPIRVSPAWNPRPPSNVTVRRNKRFSLRGTVYPGPSQGFAPRVKIVLKRAKGKKWVKAGSYWVSPAPTGMYELRIRLKTPGKYRAYVEMPASQGLAASVTRDYAMIRVR